MKRRTAFALTGIALLLSASLVAAQGSAPATSGTAARAAKPVAAVAKTRPVAAVAPAKPVAAVASAKPVAAVASAKPVAAVDPARPVVAVAPAKPVAAVAQTKPVAAVAGSALVDLNTASKADLMKLPGVGEAISAKIIAGRPWANKTQLLGRGLVTRPAYEKLSTLVIARQAK